MKKEREKLTYKIGEAQFSTKEREARTHARTHTHTHTYTLKEEAWAGRQGQSRSLQAPSAGDRWQHLIKMLNETHSTEKMASLYM